VSQRRFALLALGAGLVTTGVLTFPLPLRLGSAVLDDGSFDAYQFLWNLWWVRESVLALHRNPFFTSYLFYPGGVPLLFHTFSFSLGLASIPLQALPGGVVTGHNVLVVAAPLLAVLGLGLLAHEVTGDPWAALAGAVAGAVTGAAVWYLPVLYLDCSYLIAFVLWAWWRLQRRARGRDVLLVFALLVVLVFASQEYALMALGVLALDTVAALVGGRFVALPPRWWRGVVAFWTLAAIALGGLALVAGAAVTAPPPAWMVFLGSAYGAGLVTPPWLVPPVIPFWCIIYLGSATLVLVPAALALDRRRATFWALAAGILVSMALGPVMRWHHVAPALNVTLEGQPVPRGIPGPYAVAVHAFPLLRFFRTPYRWIVGAHVALGVTAAIGVAALRARLARPAPRRLATAAIFALVVAGAAADTRGLRAPLAAAAVPAAYRVLSEDPQPAAVLELPSGLLVGSRFAAFSSLYMYYQTFHAKFLLEGTVARRPPDRPLVIDRPVAELLALPYVKYVVLHRDFASASMAEARRQVDEADRLLGARGDLVAHDGAIDVYTLRTFRPETVRTP